MKYSLIFFAIVLLAIITSCTKGDEPVPVVQGNASSDLNFMREGNLNGGGDSNASVIGGDNNEDDDDSIIGGDDNEDDDVDIVGSDIIINPGNLGGAMGSSGGKGGN